MGEMEMSNRDYRDYRDYDNRDYRDNYREDYRDYRNYRDDYRTRDYDRRGGKINYRDYRNYRNYREENYHEELEMICEDMRDTYRKLEDVAEMISNPQEKNVVTKIAQAEKENYNYLKQIMKK